MGSGCWDGVLTQLRHDVKELLNRCSLNNLFERIDSCK